MKSNKKTAYRALLILMAILTIHCFSCSNAIGGTPEEREVTTLQKIGQHTRQLPAIIQMLIDQPPLLYSGVVEDLVVLIDSDSDLRNKMEIALETQPAGSFWSGRTVEFIYDFFWRWLYLPATSDSIKAYMDAFDDLAGLAASETGRAVVEKESFRNWLYEFVMTREQVGSTEESTWIQTYKLSDPSLLVGYWKLQGDCQDYSGKGNNGINRGVNLSSNDAAQFDGAGGYIEVPNSASLQLGSRDFLITGWVKCKSGMTNVVGDIVNKYDQALRRGVNLHVSGSSPGYSSVADARNVHFGIDNAVEGTWEDCGKPWPSNSLISTLTVYKGHLYTGIADAADPRDACHVFRYEGGMKWTDCGRVGDDLTVPSVMGMVVHKGELYAATGAWMVWWDLSMKGREVVGPVHVYRYEGGTTWHDCGAIGTGDRIQSLASFGGNLYATDDAGSNWRYDGDNNWAFVGRVPYYKILSTMVYRNSLYGGASDTVNRYDGNAGWPPVGQWNAETEVEQVHTMAVYGGSLYAGTWRFGRILRYNSDNNWTACGDLGVYTSYGENMGINEVNDLTVYNGKLYAGVIPKGEVWRYEGGEQWTMLKRLVVNPDYNPADLPTWRRVPAMTIFQGRMYSGTANCTGERPDPLKPAQPGDDIGKVFAYEAGKSVSYGDDLGDVWRHVAAARKGGRIELYIDGKLVAASSAFDGARFDLSNNNPLMIGFGAENYFNGSMRDVRLYSGE
jgi:hypothetical protein